MSRYRSYRATQRRRAFFVVLLKLCLVGGGGGLIAYYAFDVGARVSQGETHTLKAQLQESQQQLQLLKVETETNRAALSEARREADELRVLYDQVKPTEETRELAGVLREKLAQGFSARRLTQVVKSARELDACTAPSTKRFLVKTPLIKKPITNGAVRFGDVLTVWADGTGAKDNREQWYDPARPVRLHITMPGVRDSEVEGILPFEYWVSVNGSAFHFVASSAPSRGFIEVQGERCDQH